MTLRDLSCADKQTEKLVLNQPKLLSGERLSAAARRMTRALLVLGTALFLSMPTHAFQIADIRIEGLQRVTAGAVFGAIPVLSLIHLSAPTRPLYL